MFFTLITLLTFSCNKDEDKPSVVNVKEVKILNSLKLNIGETKKLNAIVLPANATNKKHTWKSSNTDVATIGKNDGKIQAIASGQTTIQVTTDDGGKTAECVVTVQKVNIESIKIQGTKEVINIGETVYLKVEILPINATNKNYTWKSEDNSIVTLNTETGIAKGVAPGTTNIIATAEEGNKTASYTIKVNKDLKLIWEENFDGTSINTSTWVKTPRGKVDWNNFMTDFDSCYKVENGNLFLRGIKNTTQTKDTATFLTGGVWSKGKKDFGYGKLEIRAKVEEAKGAWPAIWLLPSDNSPWPSGGEIDIMEHLNYDNFVYQSIHSTYTQGSTGNNPKRTTTANITKNDYNIYGVELSPDKIIFYVNNVETLSYANTGAENQFPFKGRKYYLILSMQLGGKWVGSVDPKNYQLKCI
jgi:Beta-glucanase/Beta-glucan synthetase